MEYLVGILLAFAVCLMAAMVGLDRDRAFYPVVLIVVASYFVLFAVMGGSTGTIIEESLIAAGFVAMAIWGFRSSLWVIVVFLAAPLSSPPGR